jgi:hypothetical protein
LDSFRKTERVHQCNKRAPRLKRYFIAVYLMGVEFASEREARNNPMFIQNNVFIEISEKGHKYLNLQLWKVPPVEDE